MKMEAGTYPEGIRCRHKSKPAEPFAKDREHGYVHRITPSSGINPAQAFVEWDGVGVSASGYTTWEKLDSLEIFHVRDRNDE